jgi:PhnB protein
VQTSVSPELSVRRGREALEFYKAAFGAVEIYRMGGTAEDADVVARILTPRSSVP